MSPFGHRMLTKLFKLIVNPVYIFNTLHMYYQLTKDYQEIIRIFLKRELLKRCQNNPKYSLRSFSRALDIEPSFLSKILAGKRSVSAQTFSRISKRLDLHCVDHGNAYEDEFADDFTYLQQEAQIILRFWYHFAILELLDIKNFCKNIRNISKTLGVSFFEVQQAMNRMESLKLVVQNKSTGHWANNSIKFSSLKLGPTSGALQHLQKEILKQAIEKLENCAPELRDQSTMTIAINTKLLPIAKQKIKQFRRELSKLLKDRQELDEVYQLHISLFPVTKNNKIQH